MKNKPVSPIGDRWDDYKETLLTPEERAEIAVKVALIGEIISARQNSGLTQKQLEAVSGVKQPVIARLERGVTDPQLSTLIKVLAPLGKTLAIVPNKPSHHKQYAAPGMGGLLKGIPNLQENRPVYRHAVKRTGARRHSQDDED